MSSREVALEFLAAGTPTMALPMELEVVAQLPEGAAAWLEAPLWLVDAMGERSQFARIDDKRGVARLPLNPHGSRRFGPALFPEKSRAACRLLVRIPGDQRRRDYELYARQLWKGTEVGRVTWRLAADRDKRADRRPRPQ